MVSAKYDVCSESTLDVPLLFFAYLVCLFVPFLFTVVKLPQP